MTTIVGRYVKTFVEANLASMTDVHMNGDYEFFFDIQKVDKGRVSVRSRKTGKTKAFKIRQDNYGEFFTVKHSGIYQRIFGGGPELIRVVPFKGE